MIFCHFLYRNNLTQISKMDTQKNYFLFPIFLKGLQPPVLYTAPYIKNSFLPPIYAHIPPLLQNHLLMVSLSLLSDTQLKYSHCFSIQIPVWWGAADPQICFWLLDTVHWPLLQFFPLSSFLASNPTIHSLILLSISKPCLLQSLIAISD